MQQIVFTIKWLLKRVLFLKKEYRNLLARMLYQPQSQFILHKFNAHKCPYQSMLYYNFFGRIVFAIKEFLALVSFGKICKKSILLEGFDTVTFSRIYAEGSDAILWPKSPFVELEKKELSKPFFEKITNALHLAYEQETVNKESTDTWESARKAFKKLLLDDEGKIQRDRLINFRKNSYFEKIITDQFKYVDIEDGYITAYLKAIDVVLEYHRYAKSLPKEILATLSESYAGNNHCVVYRGKRLSEKSLFYAVVLHDIIDNTRFNHTEKVIVCDIGTGYGGLPRTLKPYIDNSCYILVDLPEVLVFASYYIQYNFPDAKVALLDDIIDKKEDFSTLYEEYDFIIMPPSMLKYLPSSSVDLVTNTASLGFLSPEYQSWYLEVINTIVKKGGYFYSLNQAHTSKLGKGMYTWSFNEDYLTVYHSYSNRFAYPQWLGKKL